MSNSALVQFGNDKIIRNENFQTSRYGFSRVNTARFIDRPIVIGFVKTDFVYSAFWKYSNLRCEIQIVAICQPLKETTFRNVEIKEIVSVETSELVLQLDKRRSYVKIYRSMLIYHFSVCRYFDRENLFFFWPSKEGQVCETLRFDGADNRAKLDRKSSKERRRRCIPVFESAGSRRFS